MTVEIKYHGKTLTVDRDDLLDVLNAATKMYGESIFLDSIFELLHIETIPFPKSAT